MRNRKIDKNEGRSKYNIKKRNEGRIKKREHSNGRVDEQTLCLFNYLEQRIVKLNTAA